MVGGHLGWFQDVTLIINNCYPDGVLLPCDPSAQAMVDYDGFGSGDGCPVDELPGWYSSVADSCGLAEYREQNFIPTTSPYECQKFTSNSQCVSTLTAGESYDFDACDDSDFGNIPDAALVEQLFNLCFSNEGQDYSGGDNPAGSSGVCRKDELPGFVSSLVDGCGLDGSAITPQDCQGFLSNSQCISALQSHNLDACDDSDFFTIPDAALIEPLFSVCFSDDDGDDHSGGAYPGGDYPGGSSGSCPTDELPDFVSSLVDSCGLDGSAITPQDCQGFLSNSQCISTIQTAQSLNLEACDGSVFGTLPYAGAVDSLFNVCFSDDDGDDHSGGDYPGGSSGSCPTDELPGFVSSVVNGCGLDSVATSVSGYLGSVTSGYSITPEVCQGLTANTQCVGALEAVQSLNLDACDGSVFGTIPDAPLVDQLLSVCSGYASGFFRLSDGDDEDSSDDEGDDHSSGVCPTESIPSFVSSVVTDCKLKDIQGVPTQQDCTGHLSNQACVGVIQQAAELDLDSCDEQVFTSIPDAYLVDQIFTVCFPDGDDEPTEVPGGFGDPNAAGTFPVDVPAGGSDIPTDGSFSGGFQNSGSFLGRRSLLQLIMSAKKQSLAPGVKTVLRKFVSSVRRARTISGLKNLKMPTVTSRRALFQVSMARRRSLLQSPAYDDSYDDSIHQHDGSGGLCLFGIFPVSGLQENACPYEALNNFVSNFTSICGISTPNTTTCQQLYDSAALPGCADHFGSILARGDIPEICGDVFSQPWGYADEQGPVPFNNTQYHTELASLIENCTSEEIPGLPEFIGACNDTGYETNEYPCIFNKYPVSLTNRTIPEQCVSVFARIHDYAVELEDNCATFQETDLESLTCYGLLQAANGSDACATTLSALQSLSTPGDCGDSWQVEFNGSSLHQNFIALATRCIFDDEDGGNFFSACEVNGPYLNEGRDDDDHEDYDDRRRLLDHPGDSDGDSDGEDDGNKYNPYQLCLFDNIKVDLPGTYLDNSECPYESDRITNYTQTMMSVCGIEEFRGATCDLLIDAGNSSDTCRRTLIEFFSLSEDLDGDKSYCGAMAPASDGSRNHTFFYRHIFDCFIVEKRYSFYDIVGPCEGVELDSQSCLFNKLPLRDYTEEELAYFKCISTSDDKCESTPGCFLKRHQECPYDEHYDEHHYPDYNQPDKVGGADDCNVTYECTFDWGFNYCPARYPENYHQDDHQEQDDMYGDDGDNYDSMDDTYPVDDSEGYEGYYPPSGSEDYQEAVQVECPLGHLAVIASSFQDQCYVDDLEKETCDSLEKKAQANPGCASVLGQIPVLSKEQIAACQNEVLVAPAGSSPEVMAELEQVMIAIQEYDIFISEKNCEASVFVGGPEDDDVPDVYEPEYPSGPEEHVEDNCCLFTNATTCNANSHCNFRYNCAPRYEEWEHHGDPELLADLYNCTSANSASECDSFVNCYTDEYSYYNETLNEVVEGFKCRYRSCYEGGLNCLDLTDENGERRCRQRSKCEMQHEYRCDPTYDECCVDSSLSGWELSAACDAQRNCKVNDQCKLKKEHDNGLYDEVAGQCDRAGKESCLNITLPHSRKTTCELVESCGIDYENYCDRYDQCCGYEDKDSCDSVSSCSFHQECITSEYIDCYQKQDENNCTSSPECDWVVDDATMPHEFYELQEVCKTIGKAASMNIDFLSSLSNVCQRSHMCPMQHSEETRQTCLQANAIVLEDKKSCRSTDKTIDSLIAGVTATCNATWSTGTFPQTCDQYLADFDGTHPNCKQSLAVMDDALPRGNCLADRIISGATKDELLIIQMVLLCSGDELEPYMPESAEDLADSDLADFYPVEEQCGLSDADLLQISSLFEVVKTSCYGSLPASPSCGMVEAAFANSTTCQMAVQDAVYNLLQADSCFDKISAASQFTGRFFQYIDKCYEDGVPFTPCPEDEEEICLFGSDVPVVPPTPVFEPTLPDIQVPAPGGVDGPPAFE